MSAIFGAKSVNFGSCVARCFSTGSSLSCAKSKSLSSLSMLRKKTGFALNSVRQALVKFDNNPEEAEKWLLAEARREGWSRTQKLQGRPMSQGLIGLINVRGTAAMVEVNCETDFVAKNEKFQELVTEATMACLEHGKASGQNKVTWDKDELAQLKTDKGISLEDVVSEKMSHILENMALRRGAFVSPPPGEKDTFTGAYIHFAGQDIMSVPRDVLMGRYAALVTFTHDKSPLPPPSPPSSSELEAGEEEEDTRLTHYEIGHQLAQHVVGMNPRKIGDPATDKPRRNKDKEMRLVFQEFLMDEDLTVQDYLEENKATVVDYVRFGAGEEDVVDEETDEDDEREAEEGVVEVTGQVEGAEKA